ncbi:MAG: hypothetical protein HY831_01785 [Candidatus Aenigmarchaeota archaeon]|nr:hypothetical protein [Candidatus Aenigmarchaeota archaeon]
MADYLNEKYAYKIFKMGAEGIIGDVTKKDGLELTRKNLQDVGRKYREINGMDYFAKIISKEIKKSVCDRAVINEIREKEDITTPKRIFGKDFLVIFIDASPEIRFRRLVKRNLKRDPKTIEEFKAYEKREFQMFWKRSLGLEDCKINNNGTIAKLKTSIDKVLKENGFS